MVLRVGVIAQARSVPECHPNEVQWQNISLLFFFFFFFFSSPFLSPFPRFLFFSCLISLYLPGITAGSKQEEADEEKVKEKRRKKTFGCGDEGFLLSFHSCQKGEPCFVYIFVVFNLSLLTTLLLCHSVKSSL